MVKYIFKQLLSRLSIIRKIVKVKILNRKKDLTMINFIWMLYSEFSKTTFYKIIFLGNKIILIIVALFSFLTAYVEDLSWFNLALLASIIIAKLYSIYNIIMNKEETLNTDEFDPFIYASMALKSLSDKSEPVVNNDNDINTSIGLALIFLLFFGGLTFYQWDTDFTTTVKNISNATFGAVKTIFSTLKDMIVARFTLRRDDDGNSSSDKSGKGKGRQYDPENYRWRDDMGPGPSTSTHTIPTPPGPDNSFNSYNLSYEIENLTEKSFNPFLLNEKTSYNTIKSIIYNNNLSKVLPDFDSPEYKELMKTLDFTTSDYDISFQDFNKMIKRIDLLSNTESLAKKILDNAIDFGKAPLDTPHTFNLDTDSTTDAKSEFGKKLKGMFNKPKPDPTTPGPGSSTTDDSSVETPILTTAEIENMAASRKALTDPNIFLNRRLKPTVTEDKSDPLHIAKLTSDKKPTTPLLDQLKKAKLLEPPVLEDPEPDTPELLAERKAAIESFNVRFTPLPKKTPTNSELEEIRIRERLQKIREANEEPKTAEPWSDETPFKRITFNETVELRYEVNSEEEKELINEEYAKSYLNLKPELSTSEKISSRKNRIRKLLNEKHDSEINKLTIDSVANPEDKDLSIDDLILKNKNTPIPKAQPIQDQNRITVIDTVTSTSETADNERYTLANDLATTLSEEYKNNRKTFKEMLGYMGSDTRKELEEGFIIFDDKSKAHFKLENGEFKLIKDGYYSTETTSHTLSKDYTINLDLNKLLSKSRVDGKLVKPSELRKQADLADFYEE
uniref:Uncharacterized protein n=1 Tax=Amanita muscaria TaxID=41956 RepID=A0A5Q0N262_AMAMU|nr:hypothetical protein [Amanita muscaria]QFZ98626.1 hypothetical protein [Amanita muscaria]